MNLTCIIIDDEPIARQILEGYIAELPNMKLIGTCANAFEAVEFVQNNAVDLMFLDIHMPKLSGLNMLRAMQRPPKVILTTAYAEYALEGFELSVVDYLLKPFSFERFLKATLKIKSDKNKTSTTDALTSILPSSIFVKSDKKLIKLPFNEISHVEAYGNYIKIYTGKTILVSQTLSSFCELLPNQFLRIHKSYILNFDQLKSVEGNQIMLLDGNMLPIGKSYRSHVLSRINKT